MKVLSVILQFLLFLVVFAVGSFLHPFNLHWATSVVAGTTRFFVPDGLLLAIGVFLAILELIRHRALGLDQPKPDGEIDLVTLPPEDTSAMTNAPPMPLQ